MGKDMEGKVFKSLLCEFFSKLQRPGIAVGNIMPYVVRQLFEEAAVVAIVGVDLIEPVAAQVQGRQKNARDEK
jgi:hypothetical protein